MVEHGHHNQRIEHAEICKTITEKPREDIREYNQVIIRETFNEPEESQKNVDSRTIQIDHTPR